MLAYRLGYPGVSLVVCQTELMRSQFIQHVTFVPAQKIVVQPNPVDLKQILLKAEFPLQDTDTDAAFICAAGRLIPEKGFSLLIHAFEGIYKQYPGLKLLILGEGPERASLANLIESLELSAYVILKGRIDNPIPYFKKARLCVVSSVKEGFPNVLLEMMTANQTVVSTLCAGGIEAIPGIFKINVNSVNELEAGLKEALNNNNKINKNETVQQYLHNRTPQIFVSSLLQNF